MNTYKTFLMKGTGTGATPTWTKLVDIKDYPDLFGSPEALDRTTLSDRAKVYEDGIEESEAMEYTANYDLNTFNTLRALKGQELNFAVWFGGEEDGDTVDPTGNEGKFKFKGKLSVKISGKGVNNVREMVIRITPTTAVTVDGE